MSGQQADLEIVQQVAAPWITGDPGDEQPTTLDERADAGEPTIYVWGVTCNERNLTRQPIDRYTVE